MCLRDCSSGDLVCLSSCARDLDENLENCPCKSGCPSGCPCPNYECVDITTSLETTTAKDINQTSTTISSMSTSAPLKKKSTVLVLNTKEPHNSPFLVDSKGRSDSNFYFLYGEATSAWESCSLLHKNKYYVFGGRGDQMRQISVLQGCELKRIGSLQFDFHKGSCATVADSIMYLCFSQSDVTEYTQCRYTFDISGNFTKSHDSIYRHRWARIAASECKFIENHSRYFTNFYCYI